MRRSSAKPGDVRAFVEQVAIEAGVGLIANEPMGALVERIRAELDTQLEAFGDHVSMVKDQLDLCLSKVAGVG